MRNLRLLITLVIVGVALVGCVSGSDSGTQAPNPNSGFKALFVPLGGVVPFPNDLFFNGSTDGTLNIPLGPLADPTDTGNPVVAMNDVDGFSTQAVLDAYFTGSVAASSLVAGQDVIVLQVTTDPATKAVTGVTGALTPGTDYTVGLSPSQDTGSTIVQITPTHPLAPKTSYLVVLTSGIQDASGTSVSPDTDYADILQAELPVLSGKPAGTLANPALAQVAQFTLAQLAAAAGAGIDPTKIVLTFSFTTQSIGETLANIDANATAGAAAIAPTGLTTTDVVPGGAGQGFADVWAGIVTIPYYLSVPSSSDPTAPLTNFWHGQAGSLLTQFNPAAVKTTDVTIPVLAVTPDPSTGCTEPSTGWPVVIFQHGITRNREDMFAVADTFGGECFAVIAIDQPLHGITNTSDPFYDNQLFKGKVDALVTTERTFDLDLENNSTGAAGPDGSIDPSGTWYINLKSLLTARDNLRESAADLIALTKTIPTILDTGGKNLFDGSRIYFVGHSLGAIVGTTYLGVDKTAVSATLGMPGGNLTVLLRNSPTFAPIINAGLQAEGLVPGIQAYEDFFRNAQTVVDGGDPANYAAAAATNHPIHMIEVAGDGMNNLPDQVVPNVSTELLANIMGLQSISTTTVNPAGVRGIVRFLQGDHGSLLDPTASLAATTEMQTEMAVFAAGYPPASLPGDGRTILISDPTVVK